MNLFTLKTYNGYFQCIRLVYLFNIHGWCIVPCLYVSKLDVKPDSAHHNTVLKVVLLVCVIFKKNTVINTHAYFFASFLHKKGIHFLRLAWNKTNVPITLLPVVGDFCGVLWAFFTPVCYSGVILEGKQPQIYNCLFISPYKEKRINDRAAQRRRRKMRV